MTQEASLLLSIPEVSNLLHVQENTIRVWLSQERVLPKNIIVNLGRRVLFHKEKFMKWIDNGCPQTDIVLENTIKKDERRKNDK